MYELILSSLFFIAAFLIVYHHVGYPMLLKWASRTAAEPSLVDDNRQYRVSKQDDARPFITILVPAFNEEAWIAHKIRNLACLDYPKDRFKVIIACDGCTDNTVEVAQDTIQEAICSETHVEIVDFSVNRGKVAVINHMMQTVDSGITALSDVSALISIDALLLAEQRFQDPQVGVVNSRYQLFDRHNIGEVKYWDYQTTLQQGEASLGANIGAHGALYFFRTALFMPLKNNVINDDFVIPMQIVQSGYQAVYDPNMVALELESTDFPSDVKRRLRISAGNMQQAIMLAGLLKPRYRGVAFAFGSGKMLRLLTPYFMLTCLVTSLLLLHLPLFQAMLGLQIFGYTLAALCLLMPKVFSHRYFRFLSYFVAGHSANLYGGLRYLFGLENGCWKKV
ncbi:glycosyltransferase family 2 protein [Vibrio taketomensis]|uniref:glycosyltransferase family 2 protein n=1 Tax=Vibrio taketomensis TaxID=2572923 RepID=UPI001389F325|nr:glycosyltransferase family 2 protein [Vibrio taketomensis]